MSGWDILEREPGTVDVTPTDDLVAHTPDDDCVCGPHQAAHARPDGSTAWVVVHHSLDGREAAE